MKVWKWIDEIFASLIILIIFSVWLSCRYEWSCRLFSGWCYFSFLTIWLKRFKGWISFHLNFSVARWFGSIMITGLFLNQFAHWKIPIQIEPRSICFIIWIWRIYFWCIFSFKFQNFLNSNMILVIGLIESLKIW